jgi:uncharacterized protein YneF (UPF0154 family)
LSFIVDAVKDVIDWVAGAIEDVVDFVFDEIVEPVVSFVGDTVQALLDNPLETIAKVVAVATGNAWAIPLIDGASVAVNGGDLGDVLESVAVSYVSQAIGGEIAQHTAPFVDDVIGESLSAGLKEVAVASITQGTVAATTAILYGEDPLEAFARGGLTAAVSAGMGQIAEQIGFEVEVTDPATGQTTTRPIPNVVKNVISAALAAELTGGEVNGELLANAVTRGLITTDLVKKYIGDNPSIGDRELTYMTAAFQRTAAVALSGGTGEQAAAQIMGVISAYGMEELHDEIRDSGVGDFIGDTLDRISGDYQRVEELTALMDEIGPRLSENYAEYEEKYNALQALWSTITGNREQIMMLQADAAEPGLDPNNIFARQIERLEAELETAVVEYNRLIEEEGYLDRINELVPLIEADNEALQGYQDDLIEAQNDLQRTADRLDGELTSVYSATDEYLVSAMDPGFNAEEYRALNNLPDDVDAYAHFLSEGQHSGAYTSWNQYDIALDNARDLAMNEIMFGGFGIAENSAVWNLSDADRQALQAILRENGYDSPQALNELLTAPGEVREAVFNQWVEAIGSSQTRIVSTGDALTQNQIDLLAEQGYDMRGVAVGTEMTAEEAVALDAILRSSDAAANIELSEGVTAEDVISGNAVLGTNEDGALTWRIIPGETRWDPEYGWVTRRSTVNEAGQEMSWRYYDQDGNPVGPPGLVIYGGITDVDDNEQIGLALNAANAGMSWDSIQENLGWSDTLINAAQNVMDWVSEGDSSMAQNFLANAMKAGGGILEAFNGMSTLFGIAPDSTALGKFAQQLQDIGVAGNTEEYKAELAKLQEMMTAETDLPEDAAWYERAFARVATIAGAAAEHPSAFISEYIGVEAMQELVPLAVGGVATLGAKGAAMAMGRTLSTRMAAGTGLSAAAVTDIAESYGGTAGETYDRALTVALDSINPATGQVYTQSEAEEYAMTLAVQTGAVAATMTAATMGIGGMALEKALLGDKAATGFVGAGIDELASRIANGGTIMIKEGLTEGLEEGLATAFREGHLSQINPDIDVADEVAGAAFMGFIVGGPVSGGAYGVSQVGDAYSNFISAIDPDVRSAIENGNTVAANNALDDLGVTDPVVRNNVLSQVAPDQFVNTAQATTSFLNANPDYTATEAEINSFVQAGSYTDINEQIDRYVDDRYVDTQEVIDAAAEQGVTLTEEEAQEYVGQGPAGHEDAVLEQLGLQLGPGYTSAGEARAMFEALGYTPTDAEVAAYVGEVEEDVQEAAIAEYVDPRQVTAAEAEALFAEQNFDPSADDIAAFVGQGGANFEANTNVAPYVDPRQVTADEARSIFTDLGYEPSDSQVQSAVGQGDANHETAVAEDIAPYVDARLVTEDEARAMFEAQGYSPSDAEIAEYVGQSTRGNFQRNTNASIDTFADPRATTEAEVRAMFEAEGYTPTDAEVTARTGQGDQDFESSTGSDVTGYVDPRQVTEAEARQFFADQGYTPTDEEVQAYIGQGGNRFETRQDNAVGTYVDPRQVTADEARELFSNLGYEATDDEIASFTGQGDANFEANIGVDTYVDPRQMNAEEARAALVAQGITDPTDDQIAGLMGQGDEDFETTQQEYAVEYADPFVTTYEEARQFFNDLGFTPTKEEIEAYVGAISEEEQQAAIAAFVDPRYTDADEAREFLTALGYDPSDQEVARFTGQVREEQQQEAIAEYVDPRLVDADEVRAAYEALGLQQPTDEDIQELVGQYMESELEGRAEEYLPTARYNSIMNILNNFTGVGGLSEEEQAALDLVKQDIINAMGDLGLEVAAIDQAVGNLTDAVGSVASGDEDATGLYGYIDQAIEDLKAAGLTNEEVEATIAEIVGSPATDDADATGIYATLDALGTSIDELNDISVDDVNDIVADAIGNLENISEDDVNDIVADIVGTPATDDAPATGLYATVGDLNDISVEEVTTIVNEAIGGLENISEDDVADVVNGIIGAPATDDTDASGIYGYIDNTTDEILDVLGNPATDDTEATGLYDYIDTAVDTLGTDLATLAGNVGTPAEYDADGNVVTEATGIYAQVQDLMDQGLTNAEAIAQLAVDFGVAVTDLTNLINAQTDTITEDVGAVAEDVSDIEGLLGSPAIADNPLTEEDESADPTGLFGTIAQYEASGKERDEAISDALDDLATQLGTTKDDILEQMGLGLTQLETAVANSQTALEEKIDKAVEDIGVDLGDMETEILEKMAEYEADGIDRDDALAQAISDVSDQLGQTETDILDALTETETDILTELGTTEADILAALGETEATLASDIEAVSDLVGKPATEVTQTDIDFVVDVIAGNQVMAENQLAQYDVTGDQQITIDDQILLEQLLAGENVFDQVADTSIYAPTGVYGTVQDTETALSGQMDQNQQQTMDQIQQMEQNIVTNIEQEALRAGGRQFLQAALQAPDAMGQQVTVRTPDPLNLRYIYDFNSIFANPQQAGMFPSPYAKGGQVEDTTDKLLNIIGGS